MYVTLATKDDLWLVNNIHEAVRSEFILVEIRKERGCASVVLQRR